jgi:hypothetical protein
LAHFGLGNQTTRAIKIRWPDGTMTIIDTTYTNRWLHIIRKDSSSNE